MSNPIVSFDEEAVKSELRELVRKTIEETINAMLDEEADQLVGADPYERTDERAAYRAGHYERGFTTTSGQVTLKMPKLKEMRFATAVIERCKRRETSVEEAIIEMYLAGVSTRRIEDVGEIPWGAGVSAGTVSNLNDRAFKAVDEWRCRPLACAYPYVYVDGIYLKRSWGGSYENVAMMAAIGVNEDGYREVIGCVEGFTESKERWRGFLSWLKSRELRGARMFVGDKAAGMVGSIAEVFPKAKYQRCTVHFYRNVLAKVPKSKRSQVAAMLKAIHAMESREASAAKAEAVAADLESMKLKEAAKVVRGGYAETLAYCEMPREHWRRIRTNNAIERLIAGVTVLIGLLERHRSRADNAHPFCQDENFGRCTKEPRQRVTYAQRQSVRCVIERKNVPAGKICSIQKARRHTWRKPMHRSKESQPSPSNSRLII